MIAMFIGVVFIGLGILGLIYWFQEFLFLLRAFGPISLFFGGLVSVIAGVESIQSRRSSVKKKE